MTSADTVHLSVGDTFTPVCAEDDLWEGETFVCEVDGHQVLVVHTDRGEFLAVQGTCPHQGVSLELAEVDGSVLTCPMHLWQMDVADGSGINPSHAALALYPVRVVDGTVQVSVAGITPRSSSA